MVDPVTTMPAALVTGSSGFIGRHLVEALRRRGDREVISFDLDTAPAVLERGLREAGVIFHLAGVNRPQDPAEFKTGNADLTATLCSSLSALGRHPVIVLSSSIQAALDNPYGVSKREAEKAVERWTGSGGGKAVIFRLKNVFGKWCRPNYNSVTATLCYNIAHGLPITLTDPNREVELVYIDDVVAAFLNVLNEELEAGDRKSACQPLASDFCRYREVPRSYKVTLGELAEKIRSFRESRTSLLLPSLADEFTRCLYATYLSYLNGSDFSYSLEQMTDPRGSLAEFIKQPHFGQVFVSRTKPGVTRGNHYHHTKTEKFFVVEGEAIIRFRHILGGEIIEHRVSGKDFKVVDIPPGYAHSIENVGTTELVTLFWASEIFDSLRPDVYAMTVQPN
jgi:UDP-2-acetamido-2,6-beta-L-arabino-hexul-4-ose reductase